jgi:FAD/FMN-containing dehydrogenase
MTAAVSGVLERLLGDRLLMAGTDAFAAARRVWNAGVTRQPALIARCRDAAEVAAVVRAGRDAGLPLSVRAGGHDWGGRALCDGGLVVDLTGMRGVTVDPAGRSATVQGGAAAADLLAATAPYGLVTSTGVVRAVGMAGLTTVGGYGPLIGRYGLALDNLLEAEVVLADGSRVTAGPDDGRELWWALRGGGGNFGVVTALHYRLHELPALLTGMVMFPFEQAARVDPGATAFAQRSPHVVVEVIAAHPPAEPPDRHRAWADAVVAGLDPLALPGGYPNLLGPGDDARARDSYGANLGRLLAAKRHYDPANVFASAVPALIDGH